MRRASVALSAKWSLVGLVSKQLSRILFSVILARLLGPENFGIVGQATIYLAFSSVFLDVGLASALIQRKTIDRDLIGTATSLNAIAAVVLIGLTIATADLWAQVFSTPQLAGVLRVLSLDFVLVGAAVVPSALLTRRLDFRALALAEIVSTVIGGFAGVAAATLGAEYWALVVQTMGRDAIYAAIVLVICGRPIISWSRRAVRAILGFSTRVFGSQTLTFLTQNSDNTLIAWRLGPTALANYALSYRVLTLPVQVLTQTANRLVFPIFSRLNDQPDRQARNFLEVTRTLALTVTLPMTLICLGAPTGVPFVFGDGWEAAVRPMQVLALAAILAAVVGPSGGVMLARGKANWAFRWSVVTTLSMIGAFVVGLHWGIDGVAWSYLLMGAPLAAIQIGLTHLLVPFRGREYLRAISPAFFGGLAMAACWVALEPLLTARIGDIDAAVAVSVVCLALYLAVIRIFWPTALRDQLHFARLMVGRKAERG